MFKQDNFQIYTNSRKSRFDDLSDISTENRKNENMETKLKIRKIKLQNKINMLRKKLSANINLNSCNDLSLFINTFNSLTDNEVKKNILSLIIENNLTKVIEILKEKTDQNFEKMNKINSSELLLNLIEMDNSNENNILYIITNETQNIENIIKIVKKIYDEELSYESFYIMITGNLMLYDKKIDNFIRKNLDFSKIFDIIKKNDTQNSYSFIFFLYAYLYRLDVKKIELHVQDLISLIEMIKNKNLYYLYEDIYDLLIIFSNVYSFNKFFFANYQLLFGDKDFEKDDKLLTSKLSIINNIFKTLSSQEILYYLNIKNNNRSTNNIINLILNSLTILSQMKYDNSSIFINNMQIILLSLKILLTLSFHKELTNSLLENKTYINLIVNIFNNFLTNNDNLINNSNIYYDKQINVIMMIVINIIKNEYLFFISLLISNNIHLKINQKFNYFLSNKVNVNEETFVNLLNIIISLLDNEKKANLKTEITKIDLSNNGICDNITGIMKKFSGDNLINQKCSNFLEVYYPEQSQIQMNIIELSNFNFINN